MAEPLSSVELLHHLAYHIFLPPELPQAQLKHDAERQVNLRLTRSVVAAVSKYKVNDIPNATQWDCIVRMLEQLFSSIAAPLEKTQLSQDMIDLKAGGRDNFWLLHRPDVK